MNYLVPFTIILLSSFIQFGGEQDIDEDTDDEVFPTLNIVITPASTPQGSLPPPNTEQVPTPIIVEKQRKGIPNISKCNNPINIISQETWDKENTDTLIFIEFPTRIDCYLLDDLEEIVKQGNKTMEWKPNPQSKQRKDTIGYGYMPDKSKSERYIALPIAQDWVEVKSLTQILQSNERTFQLVSNGKKRLGNVQGTFGVSEIHGQAELETWILKSSI